MPPLKRARHVPSTPSTVNVQSGSVSLRLMRHDDPSKEEKATRSAAVAVGNAGGWLAPSNTRRPETFAPPPIAIITPDTSPATVRRMLPNC